MMDQGLKLNILSWEHSDGKVIGSFGSAVYVNGMLLQRLSGGASHHPRESTREREREKEKETERKKGTSQASAGAGRQSDEPHHELCLRPMSAEPSGSQDTLLHPF